MLDAERMRSRMDEAGVSQAELARSVGVKQQSIARLVTGEAVGTRYLHRIARRLGTTPAYLTGETDDPNAESPVAIFTADELEVIEIMRALDERDRAALIQIGRSLAYGVKP